MKEDSIMLLQTDPETEASASHEPPDHPKPLTISAIAVQALLDHGNDIPSAAEALLTRLKRELPDEYRERRNEALIFWARIMVGEARRNLRTHIANEDERRGRDGGADSLRAFAMTWLDWPVLPGLMLRDACKGQLVEAAGAYARDADTFTKRGRWLAALAEMLPNDDVTVSQALTEEAVAKKAEQFGVSQVRMAA